MEDICVPFFTGKGCSMQPCPNAHTFEQLCNQDHWVLFDAAHIDMVDFIAYKYQVHHYFKCHFLPNQGPLVRFATSEDAKNIIKEYKDYYNPRLLVDLCQEDSHTTSNSEQTETQSLTKSGSSNSLDKFESSSSASNNNSLSWPTNTPTNICWADEVEDLPLEELSENELPLENNTSNVEKNKEINNNINQKSKSRKNKSNRNKGEDDHKSSKGSRKPPIYGKNQPFRGPPTKTPSKDNNESCTERVLRILRENETLRKEHATGWVALKDIWNITEKDLDEAVLNCLNRKTAAEQEHILLSFAAIELSNVMNLSAYLNCLIKEHDGTNQVCLYFLADLCHDPECTYVHPVNTGGWDVLYKKWQITYRDLDYGVLNYLSKKSEKDQNEILCSLADMNLNAIHNLSAYLSSMIQKHESNKTGKHSSEAVKGKRSQNHGRNKQSSVNVAVESNTNTNSNISNNSPSNNTMTTTSKTESILVPPYFPVWSAPNMVPPVWVHPALITRGF